MVSWSCRPRTRFRPPRHRWRRVVRIYRTFEGRTVRSLVSLRSILESRQIAIYFAAVVLLASPAWQWPSSTALAPAIEPLLALMLFATFLQVPLTELSPRVGGQALSRRFAGRQLSGCAGARRALVALDTAAALAPGGRSAGAADTVHRLRGHFRPSRQGRCKGCCWQYPAAAGGSDALLPIYLGLFMAWATRPPGWCIGAVRARIRLADRRAAVDRSNMPKPGPRARPQENMSSEGSACCRCRPRPLCFCGGGCRRAATGPALRGGARGCCRSTWALPSPHR